MQHLRKIVFFPTIAEKRTRKMCWYSDMTGKKRVLDRIQVNVNIRKMLRPG